jgi:CxxC motif-containing protein (DUF1111 family)
VTTPSLPTAPQTPVSSVPPALQLPSGVDMSNPGVVVKPAAVTASTALGADTAAMAVDGDTTTRWESAHTDNEWIQFDFGAKTPVGSMKLVWENAHAQEYVIQVSDDGQTWYQLRYVVGSPGATEQFMNLDSNARYMRMLGIKRATQYGYSLFEVQFESPGSDNTLGSGVTASAIPFPANGAQLAPPPPAAPPLEGLQFSLPDGTLVTRWGTVGRGRHGRERGEDWNEIGYGPNDTVDAAGNPVDKGPGNYLTFVKNYFKDARTWGIEIIDNSHVAGVTKPTLRMNQYFKVQQKGGGESFFRGFDRPGVTGYGWMTAGTLVNPQVYTNDLVAGSASCPVVPYPPEGQLASASGLNNGCSVTVDNYPGHADLSPDANGVLVPNGKSIASRPLQVGDVVEVSTSFFSTPAFMAVLNDDGAFRYYTNEWTYVVGTGLVPQMGVQPRLMNAPLPADTLQGGLGSVSYDYADNPEFMFQQPDNNIGMQDMNLFVKGRRWFHTYMDTGEHTEEGNDVNADAVGLLGPHFNQKTCFGCHINNGRSLAPTVINQRLDTMAVFTAALDGNAHQVPHPMYGVALQMNSQQSTAGVTTDWGLGAYVSDFQTMTATFADGTTVQLRKPKIAFDGPTPSIYSLRSAPPVVGMGMLAAIPDADIIAHARTAPDADGVKGIVNYGYDPATGATCVGRFGWKAAKCTVQHQVVGALLQDMSVTSSLYPNRDCLFGPAKCNKSKVEPGISDDAVQLMTRYVSLLGVPAQRSQVSGFPKGVSPLPYLDVNPTQIAAGAKVFDTIGCASCHTKQWKTGASSELAETRNQVITPYTDLLLHDMGPDLADGFTEGQATGNMFRTSPLWGVGYTQWIAGKERTGNAIQVGFLHDGRAANLTEAIAWHGGESNTSKQRFMQLSTQDRSALLAFLGSL